MAGPLPYDDAALGRIPAVFALLAPPCPFVWGGSPTRPWHLTPTPLHEWKGDLVVRTVPAARMGILVPFPGPYGPGSRSAGPDGPGLR